MLKTRQNMLISLNENLNYLKKKLVLLKYSIINKSLI